MNEVVAGSRAYYAYYAKSMECVGDLIIRCYNDKFFPPVSKTCKFFLIYSQYSVSREIQNQTLYTLK